MNPINPNQERKINKAFIYIVLLLAVAQIFNIILNTL